ncbi:IclR family transcriptional regulator [Actinoplanes sp. CA-131856]
MTLSEITRRSGLPKSTTHRILTMLVELDAVEREGDFYWVGLRMFTMGALSVDASVRDVALPHLERLRRLTRQTVHLAVLHDDEVVYLEKLPSLASPNTPALVGGRLPAQRTGVGKALLAFGRSSPPTDPALAARLHAVRRSGVAYDHQEAASGLSCVAVPVLDADRAIAAVSVAFHSADGSGDRFVGALQETAIALSRSIRSKAQTR